MWRSQHMSESREAEPAAGRRVGLAMSRTLPPDPVRPPIPPELPPAPPSPETPPTLPEDPANPAPLPPEELPPNA
jgi:hypothetical protein